MVFISKFTANKLKLMPLNWDSTSGLENAMKARHRDNKSGGWGVI